MSLSLSPIYNILAYRLIYCDVLFLFLKFCWNCQHSCLLINTTCLPGGEMGDKSRGHKECCWEILINSSQLAYRSQLRIYTYSLWSREPTSFLDTNMFLLMSAFSLCSGGHLHFCLQLSLRHFSRNWVNARFHLTGGGIMRGVRIEKGWQVT